MLYILVDQLSELTPTMAAGSGGEVAIWSHSFLLPGGRRRISQWLNGDVGAVAQQLFDYGIGVVGVHISGYSYSCHLEPSISRQNVCVGLTPLAHPRPTPPLGGNPDPC
jgi:hypothetical protein